MNAPKPYETAAMATIISGVFNIITGVFMFWTLIGLGNLGIGLMQVSTGRAMRDGQRQPDAKKWNLFGAALSLVVCNPIALIAAGFALKTLGEDEVVGWLEG